MYFLNKVLDTIKQDKNIDNYYKTIIIPSNRARGFVMEYYKKDTDSTIIPNILTFGELIKENYDNVIVDSSELVFLLYQAYYNLEQNNVKIMTFSDFYHYAYKILADFNELDYYSKDIKKVFQLQEEIIKIENWDLEKHSLIIETNNYLNHRLFDYYTEFNRILDYENLAYSGKAYRYLSENINNLLVKYDNQKIYFVGFNALTDTEYSIINSLKNNNIAKYFVDADYYYIDKIIDHEAGYFIKKNKNLFENKITYIENNILENSKNINIFSFANRNIQLAKLHELLSQLDDTQLQNSAIILSDENLLYPLMYYLPNNVNNFNISVSYKFKNSHIYTFLKHLFNILIQYHNNGIVYYTAINDLIDDKLSSYLLDIEKIKSDIINNNYEVLFESKIKEYLDKYAFLLINKNQTNLAHSFITNIEKLLEELLQNPDFNDDLIQKEFGFAFLDYIIKFENKILKYNFITEISDLKKIFLKEIDGIKIDILGEPLAGLQILGLLETRALEFENVYVLDLNEGILPKRDNNESNLFYETKINFGLPLRKDKEAVFSHNFYRLFHNCKNITLMYIKSENNFILEESRYIKQIQEELVSDKISMQFENFKGHTNSKKIIINLNKSEFYFSKIKQKLQQGLSYSFLKSYDVCSMNFYYEKILNIEYKNDKSQNFIEPNVIGNIIHNTLYNLYLSYANNNYLMQPHDFDNIINNIDNEIKNAIIIENIDSQTVKNQFYIEKIKQIIKNTIHYDKELVVGKKQTLEILELEKKTSTIIEQNGEKLNIYGIIDRIDKVDGKLRIVDYKTGKIESDEYNVSKNISNIFNKKASQLLFYYLLIEKEYKLKSIKDVNLHFYSLIYDKIDKNVEFYDNCIQLFKEKIFNIYEEIIDINKNIIHTKNSIYCKFCNIE